MRGPATYGKLENVIERAVITAVDGHINLKRALPDLAIETAAAESMAQPGDTAGNAIRTETQMRALERDNIMLALVQSDWRIAGQGGAAELLGMRPSTLSSRIKSLGLTRS